MLAWQCLKPPPSSKIHLEEDHHYRVSAAATRPSGPLVAQKAWDPATSRTLGNRGFLRWSVGKHLPFFGEGLEILLMDKIPNNHRWDGFLSRSLNNGIIIIFGGDRRILGPINSIQLEKSWIKYTLLSLKKKWITMGVEWGLGDWETPGHPLKTQDTFCAMQLTRPNPCDTRKIAVLAIFEWKDRWIGWNWGVLTAGIPLWLYNKALGGHPILAVPSTQKGASKEILSILVSQNGRQWNADFIVTVRILAKQVAILLEGGLWLWTNRGSDQVLFLWMGKSQ